MKLKKKFKIILAIIIILVVAVTAFFVYRHFTTNNKKPTEVTVISKIDSYGYQLESNKTKVYNDLFNHLKEVLTGDNIDEEEYVKTIAQLFLVDFYTLKNKLSNADIGGVQFLAPSIQENFILKAKNTIYKYVKSNIYGDREQTLPEVKEVTVDEVTMESFEYGENKDEQAYKVKCTIHYVEDLGYDTEKELIFVHEDNKLVLVEMN